VTVGRGWLFLIGGQITHRAHNYHPTWSVNRTFLLNVAEDTTIDGPYFDGKADQACSAIISDDGNKKVVAVLGGDNEWSRTFKKFECSFNGSTPVCSTLPNGPGFTPDTQDTYGQYVRGDFSCGVLRTEQGQEVLLAFQKSAIWTTRSLDLSNATATWQIVPGAPARTPRRGIHNFITNKDKTIGYQFGIGTSDWQGKYNKITCKTPTDCTFETKNIANGKQVGEHATVLAVPNDEFSCP